VDELLALSRFIFGKWFSFWGWVSGHKTGNPSSGPKISRLREARARCLLRKG
jgi:hypothetical protein